MATERSRDEIARARKQKRRKIRRRRLLAFGAVLLVALFAVIVVCFYSDSIAYDLRDGVRSVFSFGSFPAEIGEEKITQVELGGRCAVLLSKRDVTVLSGSGGILMAEDHGFANAGMACKKNRIVVFSRQGKGYGIYNRSMKLAAGNTDYPIIDAAVSVSGKVAILTQADEFTSELVVFNKNTTERFSWYGSDGFPFGVFSSDTADVVAVVSVKSVDGRVVSVITLIDLNGQKERKSFTVEGLAAEVIFDGDVLVVILDDRAIRCRSDGTLIATYSYEGRPLLSISYEGGRNIALALGDNSRSEMNQVSLISKKLEVTGVVDFRREIFGIFQDDSRAYVLTRGSVYAYSSNGTLRESYDCEHSAYRVLDLGGPMVIKPGSVIKLTKERESN